MTGPLLFTFGLHLHQPVGNFDSVFEQHLTDVYRPLLAALDRGEAWPVTLHLSGPLFDWLEAHAPDYLDELGARVADGRIELLLAGYDEPILAVLSRDDRLEQIARMREYLRRRFGVTATGVWLTERVWEPDLAEDLARAGARYVLVDDRHFLVAGFESGALHRPFRTESGGHSLGVFPIDERLRYLVPFHPPSELARYFRQLRAAGAPLAILADDGEKFGGWPGTLEWVYRRGWMEDFLATLRALRESDEVRLATFGDALATVPSAGLAYLPSASYREMESWALPPAAARRLAFLERTLGDAASGPEGALIRGTHWRTFLARYPESNRMHKKMLALSTLARERGDPPAARRAIGRAQCNDAYWHGVFGGLYLPHLRDGIWRELAKAEGILRAGEGLAVETLDLDRDGNDEIWIHGAGFSALVSPARGGAIEEWTFFGRERNLANTLTRRLEAYHQQALERAGERPGGGGSDGTASIHDLEDNLALAELPPIDRTARAILQERVIDDGVTLEQFARGDATPLVSWVETAGSIRVEAGSGMIAVIVALNGLTKRIEFDAQGVLRVELTWTVPPAVPAAWFTTELSISGSFSIEAPDATLWRYPIETVAKSERGFDRTVQGTAVLVRWPVEAGRGGLRLEAEPAPT